VAVISVHLKLMRNLASDREGIILSSSSTPTTHLARCSIKQHMWLYK